MRAIKRTLEYKEGRRYLLLTLTGMIIVFCVNSLFVQSNTSMWIVLGVSLFTMYNVRRYVDVLNFVIADDKKNNEN